MHIFDHFSFIAPFYDRVFKPGERDWLFELVGLPVAGLLLDAGGGTGRISQSIGDQAGQVVVADLSYDMLLQAISKGGLHPICTPTEKLPFEDRVFDRIIMIDALHHVYSQGETILELWRVLLPGGRIVIEEPDVQKFGVKVLAAAEKVLGMRSHFLDPPSIASLFPASADIRIVGKGVITWVIVEKPGIID
jgi:demethylmenaquinone methyltransferase/2-methoxy-6-polyprenyl-1,4-benzoquinol methylase